MATKLRTAILVIGTLSLGSVSIYAADPLTARHDVRLSPDLLNLLRSEMREIAGGVQSITLSLVTADWNSIQATSAKIRASYIMEKKLTPAQAKELEQALPPQFKRLDAEFHQRAEKLGAAAATHDYELVAFQYSRLLENCAQCHSAYAKSRFPGFATTLPQGHER
jgi:cytochrome c556